MLTTSQPRLASKGTSPWRPLAAGLCLLIGLVGDAAAAQRGPETHDARSLVVRNLVGTLDVTVADIDGIEVTLTGPEEEIARLKVDVVGGALRITHDHTGAEVWPPERVRPAIAIRLPDETPVDIRRLVGDARIDDLHAPFELSLYRGTVVVGDVSEAEVTITGSGTAELGAVADEFDLTISGSGQASSEAVGGPLAVTISGGGAADIGQVAAKVDVTITGSGDVEIDDGTAKPLRVAITGSGDFLLNGEAVDPTLVITGSGDIRIRAYSGSLTKQVLGSGDISIGP